MSMRSWTIDGYGVDITKIKFTNEKFAEFARKYLISNFSDLDINENSDNEEIFGAFDYGYISRFNGELGVEAAIADVIREKTDIDFEYVSSDIGPTKAILLCCAMPWQYKRRELALTPESINDILLPYFIQLGIEKIDCESLSIEFFG